MDIAASNAGRCQALRRALGLQQQINHLVSSQVPPLEHDRFCTQVQQVLGGLGQGIGIGNGAPQQQSGFVQVGGDHAHAWKQFTHQHLHGFAGNQTVATGGYHHRVKHHPLKFVVVNGPSHHLDNTRGVQHADLDGVDTNVLHNRLDLGLQELGRYGVNALHAQRVLRRQGGDGGHAVTAQGGKSFQIGLNASAAATVRSGDGQNACVSVRSFHARNYARITHRSRP